jgi:hypothetical protein
MNTKMIVTDLDGTLLRSDLTVSGRTEAALRQCKSTGVKIVYATGRGGSAEQIVPDGLFDGRIINNGAVAFADGNIYKNLISYQEARPFLLACDRRGFKVTTQSGAMHYTNFDVALVWPHIKNFKIVDFSSHELDSEKICMTFESGEDLEFVKQYLTDNMYLTVARDGLGMIMHIGATKSKAVAFLAGRWGIKQEEIVCFGDDLNDIDMLQYCGVGVAMANALDEVKKAADYICDTNDNDGVAKWIEERIL